MLSREDFKRGSLRFARMWQEHCSTAGTWSWHPATHSLVLCTSSAPAYFMHCQIRILEHMHPAPSVLITTLMSTPQCPTRRQPGSLVRAICAFGFAERSC